MNGLMQIIEAIKPLGLPREKVYLRGDVLLLNADCLDVLPLLPSGCVELVVTSPPYNLKKKWWDSGANGIHKDLAAKFAEEWYDDELPEDEYQRQQRSMLADSRRISAGSVCYNHKIRHAFKREGRTFHPVEWTGGSELWCEIIWDRGPGPAVNCRRPVMSDERIFVFGRPSAWNDLGYTSIWKFPPNREETGHPCAFPIELPLRLIKSFTNPSGMVCDPYGGVATTAIACLQTGRKFIGCEISGDYFATACKRLDDEFYRTALIEPPPPRIEQSSLFAD